MARLLGLLLICLWPLATLSANEVLVVGASDQAGMRSFAQALQVRRGNDQVRFQPVSSLLPPSQLPRDLRLILLD
ncbi:hypothetical protein ACQJ0H_22795, partial [Pantoea agglomerans]